MRRGHMDDGSRQLIAGPFTFKDPSKIPMKETLLSLHLANRSTTTKTFNPAPPSTIAMRALGPQKSLGPGRGVTKQVGHTP